MTVESVDRGNLPRSESMALLRSVPVGRVVFTARALPAITPVSFVVLGNGDVVIRSDVGSKLSAATRESVVAFQADSYNDGTHDGWSVVVTGRSRHVVSVEELVEIDGLQPVRPATQKRQDVIRITAEIVEGRRMAARSGDEPTP
jgi:nitroimidazol reductase NimA-like FMN-containing flavoprotein (pyridoxamine 5'-phosphate oxidase superfamily)